MNNPSPLTRLAKVLEELPVYTASFFISLLAAVLSDYILTALLIACVFLGFITSPLIALSAFFFVYVVIHTLNSVANAIGHSGGALVSTIKLLMAPPPPVPFTPSTSTLSDTAPPVT